MEFKVENLCGFLIRSKLMSPAEMQAMRQRWNAEAKENAAQVPQFLRWLMTKSYLTEYQASLLSRGHVDDFFLGDYKILERVGRGRMAGVYKAVHASGQIVAIKVLPPSRAKSGQTLMRFQREARLAVKLKHPHVVRAFQVGETRTVHFLVMEFLEGDTLDEVLHRRKRLPAAEAVRLMHQALLGLQHIHEMGMVHRDLKPANLMLIPGPGRADSESTLRANIKILDIGLAREFFDENAPVDGIERMELTGEGVLLGTPDYLAPEQARDPRNIDIRADVYSLGCTLYHLLTGQPPFPDKNILNQMIRHATETPKPIRDFMPNVPEGLEQIVNWMMAKQPKDRYPTPARAAQALDAFLMVTSDSQKPAEESPNLKKYLTWLELSEKIGEHPAGETIPPPAVPVAARAHPVQVAAAPMAVPAKPPSNPNVPVALAKPAPAAVVAKPVPIPAPPAKALPLERKRKKRTGVHMEAAAAIPIAAPAVPATPPAPAAMPVEQFDVELVDIPTRPTAPAPRSRLRDLMMISIGIVVMLAVFGAWTLISMILQWLSPGE